MKKIIYKKMSAKIKTLYTLEEPSTNLIDSPKSYFDSVNYILEFELFSPKEKKERKYRMIFKEVSNFRYSGSAFRDRYLSGAYDNIIEIINSDWLQSINYDDYRLAHLKKENLHHYVIYFDDVGTYEFIAESFEVEKIN